MPWAVRHRDTVPHLQFETTEPLDAAQKETVAEWVTGHYAELMETGTDHVGVTVRDGAFLTLGRATSDEPVAFLNADIRAGRSFEQRRELAEAVIEALAEHWDVPPENTYVVYTEHDGEAFHLSEGALASWSDSEAAGDGPI